MTTQYIQKNNYDVTKLEDSYVVLNTDNVTVTTLNEVGGYCWELLSVIQSVASMVGALQNKFDWDVPAEEVREDVKKYLDELMECGLIEYVDYR